jgi:hypothetical protein
MNVIVNLRGGAFSITFERDVNRASFKAFPQGDGTALKEAAAWLVERIPRSAEDAEAGYFRVTHAKPSN